MNCSAVLILMLFFLAPVSAQAKINNLGVVGETYPVMEPDILAELQQQAAANQPGKTMLERIENYQPVGLHPLAYATANKTFLVDMTYTLDRDLTDGEGRVIYPKGYTFNPLDYVSFPGGLIVIDGNDPRQVAWFKKTPYADNHRVKLLLSDGQAAGLIEKLQRPVFYLTDDIAKRLQLSVVPALVIQQGDRMQVMEFKVNDQEQGKASEDE